MCFLTLCLLLETKLVGILLGMAGEAACVGSRGPSTGNHIGILPPQDILVSTGMGPVAG